MPDYRLALDRTSDTLTARARNFHNLVVAFVIIGLASLVGAIALGSLRAVSGLLLLAPAYMIFLWRDIRILNRWRKQLVEAWRRREIDMSAYRHAVNANPTLPRSTVQAMLDTLPGLADIPSEQAVSPSTRQAIVNASNVRDGHRIDTVSFQAVSIAIAVFSVVLSIILSWWTPLFAPAMLLPMAAVSRWRQYRRMDETVTRLRALAESADFNADQYRAILGALEWDANSLVDKKRLFSIGNAAR